jgi:lysozyme
MNISNNGIELIKKFEGFSAVPYKDVAGYPTIGFGHKIIAGEVFGSIGSMEATALLEKDVQWAVTVINTAVHVVLNQNQFDALCSFTYNVGAHAFATSTLLKLLNEEKYGEASNEFLKWANAGGKRNESLYRRRQNEREFFLTGKTL